MLDVKAAHDSTLSLVTLRTAVGFGRLWRLALRRWQAQHPRAAGGRQTQARGAAPGHHAAARRSAAGLADRSARLSGAVWLPATTAGWAGQAGHAGGRG